MVRLTAMLMNEGGKGEGKMSFCQKPVCAKFAQYGCHCQYEFMLNDMCYIYLPSMLTYSTSTGTSKWYLNIFFYSIYSDMGLCEPDAAIASHES